MAIWLLDQVGRRPLLLTGTAGMVVGMAVTAVAFIGHGTTLHGGQAVVAVIGLMIYTGSFAVGLGPVFWLIIAEIYPLGVRGRAMSVATIGNWAANFVVTISFLTILNAIGGRRVLRVVRLPVAGRAAVLLAQGSRDQGPHPAGDRARPRQLTASCSIVKTSLSRVMFKTLSTLDDGFANTTGTPAESAALRMAMSAPMPLESMNVT